MHGQKNIKFVDPDFFGSSVAGGCLILCLSLVPYSDLNLIQL